MKEEAKAVSLKFIGTDGSPLDYIMVEGTDVQQAKALAARWAEQNISQPFDRIEEHQGLITSTDKKEDDCLDGCRIWLLPF